MADKKVGVLALQGDFEAHERVLRRIGADVVQVRTTEQLQDVQALVLPGGESTTMLKLLNQAGLKQSLIEFSKSHPVFGTCAGAILLAHEVTNPAQESLDVMDIAVERNAYGRQLDSRIVQLTLDERSMEAVFIRAPIIRRVGPAAKVLTTYNGDPVLVEQGLHLVSTFHPELTSNPLVHELFLSKIKE